MSKKRGYGQLSVRAHVGDDVRVNLFNSGEFEPGMALQRVV